MISVRITRRGRLRLVLLALAVAIGYTGLGILRGEYVHEQAYAAGERVANVLEKTSLLDLRVCRCGPEVDVRFQRDDGLTIAGSLYGVGDSQERPAILLLHGNTPRGRNLPLYKVLGRKLSDRGYLVLAIDTAGFGESGDPFSFGTLEALDDAKDVHAALSYLKSLDSVQLSRIYIVAHSGGAIGGFVAGIEDGDVKGIAAIGPPRRASERQQDPADADYWWDRAKRTRREVYDSEFPSWWTKEAMVEYRRSSDSNMDNHLGYFSTAGHKPLLLIDGELESEADKDYLREYYESIVEPRKYVTIPGSDHYANSRHNELGAFVRYDRKTITATVSEIDRWIGSIQ